MGFSPTLEQTDGFHFKRNVIQFQEEPDSPAGLWKRITVKFHVDAFSNATTPAETTETKGFVWWFLKEKSTEIVGVQNSRQIWYAHNLIPTKKKALGLILHWKWILILSPLPKTGSLTHNCGQNRNLPRWLDWPRICENRRLRPSYIVDRKAARYEVNERVEISNSRQVEPDNVQTAVSLSVALFTYSSSCMKQTRPTLHSHFADARFAETGWTQVAHSRTKACPTSCSVSGCVSLLDVTSKKRPQLNEFQNEFWIVSNGKLLSTTPKKCRGTKKQAREVHHECSGVLFLLPDATGFRNRCNIICTTTPSTFHRKTCLAQKKKKKNPRDKKERRGDNSAPRCFWACGSFTTWRP